MTFIFLTLAKLTLERQFFFFFKELLYPISRKSEKLLIADTRSQTGGHRLHINSCFSYFVKIAQKLENMVNESPTVKFQRFYSSHDDANRRLLVILVANAPGSRYVCFYMQRTQKVLICAIRRVNKTYPTVKVLSRLNRTVHTLLPVTVRSTAAPSHWTQSNVSTTHR